MTTSSVFRDGDSWWPRVVAVFVVVFISVIITRFGMRPSGAYTRYIVPSPIQPPDKVFGIVWGVLYAALTISWLLCAFYACRGGKPPTRVDTLFMTLFFLTLFWVILFFGFALVIPSAIVLIIIVIYGSYMLYLTWVPLCSSDQAQCCATSMPDGIINETMPFMARIFVFVTFFAFSIWVAFATVLNLTVRKRTVPLTCKRRGGGCR